VNTRSFACMFLWLSSKTNHFWITICCFRVIFFAVKQFFVVVLAHVVKDGQLVGLQCICIITLTNFVPGPSLQKHGEEIPCERGCTNLTCILPVPYLHFTCTLPVTGKRFLRSFMRYPVATKTLNLV